MANYYPANPVPQYATEQTPRGALVRALQVQYPYSLPADMEELAEFVAGWVLSQDTNRLYIGITEAVATMENWWNERLGMLS